jgi:hypothetical protein
MWTQVIFCLFLNSMKYDGCFLLTFIMMKKVMHNLDVRVLIISHEKVCHGEIEQFWQEQYV